MGLLDFLGLGRAAPDGGAPPSPRADLTGESEVFWGLDDPRFLEFIRGVGGRTTASGLSVTTELALRNTTVLRCVMLVAGTIGMLPLHLRRKDTKAKADSHELFRVLHRRPNAWQTASEFRAQMEQRCLTEGDAIARIVRSRGRILALVPIAPGSWTVRQRPDWSLEYEITRPDGGRLVLAQGDVFHLRDTLSEDGLRGASRVKRAAEAIGLAQRIEEAAARLFRQGTFVGGRLEVPGKLSQEAYDRLRDSLESRRGVENAHRDMVLEEGTKYQPGAGNGKDVQAVEQRKHQIEEIGRVFGVPRPLLGVDDTSWGSGIDVLGQMFVRYGLNPRFAAWEQAIERDLMSDADAAIHEVRFNAGALLRGSMLEQGRYFALASGSGGHRPWMPPREIRDVMDLEEIDDLPGPPGSTEGEADEPPPAA